jgi:hypothetical protein
MIKLNKLLSALVLSFTAYLAGTASASAISLNLNWIGTGDVSGTYSLTGSFTGNNTVVDDFIRSSDNEISDFTLIFRRDADPTTLATYDFNQITTDSSFNFNYQISTNTILQTGGSAGSPSGLTGLSIGNSSGGYSLDSFSFDLNGGKLTFNDNTGALPPDSANGGNLTATAVPFEFDGSAGILTLGAIWGVNKWRKNRIKK